MRAARAFLLPSTEQWVAVKNLHFKWGRYVVSGGLPWPPGAKVPFGSRGRNVLPTSTDADLGATEAFRGSKTPCLAGFRARSKKKRLCSRRAYPAERRAVRTVWDGGNPVVFSGSGVLGQTVIVAFSPVYQRPHISRVGGAGAKSGSHHGIGKKKKLLVSFSVDGLGKQ